MTHTFALLVGASTGAVHASRCRISAARAHERDRSAAHPDPKICIVGEALIDFLPAATIEGETAYRWRPGGAPFNVCIAAARLGVSTTFLGNLSTDLFGEELFHTLENEGVNLSLVERLPQPTTLAFVSPTPGADVKYAFFKENAADRSLQASKIDEIMRGRSFGALHVSLGAVTLEDLPMAEAFAKSFRQARDHGGFTSFDCNIREPMISGGTQEYRDRVERFTCSADVAKASDADIEFLYGEGAKLDVVAGLWLALGPKLVVVTCGAQGALAFFKDANTGRLATISATPACQTPNTIDSKGRPVPVADTVGAGDTCMGALLFGLLGADGGLSLANQVRGSLPWDTQATTRLSFILEIAVTCAAITCSRSGADPPTRSELDNAMSILPKRPAAPDQ